MVSVEPASGEESTQTAPIMRMRNGEAISSDDVIAVEEPLELQLRYGARQNRVTRSISVTMRTPGNDRELVAGFLLTEGVLNDAAQIQSIQVVQGSEGHNSRASKNTVRVTLEPSVEFNLASLERNFYTTSSCGICGKASLLAIRSICPPRASNRLKLSAEMLYQLPALLRAQQQAFQRTGGLHACGLFDADGQLLALREDVGRHNACDKLIGREFLADRTPLRDRILLLSGRASFELLQKGVMAGFSAVVSVGAPSSMAVEIAREFDITLVGFLRDQSFNIYHGADRVQTSPVQKDLR